ncbi:MAG: hypothetical protein V4678_02375 [Patescibacteria group bacterium]
MGVAKTLQESGVNRLMGLTQRTLEVLHGNASAERQIVKSDATEFEEEVFVLSPGWCLSLDGDHYWMETSSDTWIASDACNIPLGVARRFRNEMNKLIQ